jgi:hypothetical protein
MSEKARANARARVSGTVARATVDDTFPLARAFARDVIDPATQYTGARICA